ncbi:hypothetical protein EMCRGX_G022673 [Ephydatia muelleri]|eukprot:Em0017g947a
MDVRKNIALKLKDSAPSGNGTAAKPSERKEKKPKRKKEANKPSDIRGEVAGGVATQDEHELDVKKLKAAPQPTPPLPTTPPSDGLKYDQHVNLIGRPTKDPLLHLCEICTLPILIYGRMKKCRHAFCRDCAKKSAGSCPKCKEDDQSFEEASIGAVYICTEGGGRYDNKGCARSYLSQRDLEAHAVYRHAATVTSSSTSSTVAVPVAASVVTTASNTIPFSYSFLSAMPRPPELALSAHGSLPPFPPPVIFPSTATLPPAHWGARPK